MTETVPLSVIIPTLGGVGMLQACLKSLAACNRPAPGAEVIVVVQWRLGRGRLKLIARFTESGARSLAFDGRGLNVGLREAEHDLVLVTDDDCRVSPSTVGSPAQRSLATPTRSPTGHVHPVVTPTRFPPRWTTRLLVFFSGPQG